MGDMIKHLQIAKDFLGSLPTPPRGMQLESIKYCKPINGETYLTSSKNWEVAVYNRLLPAPVAIFTPNQNK